MYDKNFQAAFQYTTKITVGCAVRTKFTTIFKLFSYLVRRAHPT
nr:hypothetical protein [Alysiella crassa]